MSKFVLYLVKVKMQRALRLCCTRRESLKINYNYFQAKKILFCYVIFSQIVYSEYWSVRNAHMNALTIYYHFIHLHCLLFNNYRVFFIL